MPLQPASHVHAATAWRVPNEGVSHTPWFEQPFGHFGLEQSKPPQPGAHRHEPGATQRPREEQPDAQCGWAQLGPIQPPEQEHWPGAAQ